MRTAAILLSAMLLAAPALHAGNAVKLAACKAGCNEAEKKCKKKADNNIQKAGCTATKNSCFSKCDKKYK
jgi:hypothetical protein